jgi:hypothetical protein
LALCGQNWYRTNGKASAEYGEKENVIASDVRKLNNDGKITEFFEVVNALDYNQIGIDQNNMKLQMTV